MQLFFFSRVVIRTPQLRGSFPPTPCTSQPHPAPGRPEKGAPGGSSPLPAATERIRCSIKTPSCHACSLLETKRLTILFTATKQSKHPAELCWASLCQGAENLHREGAGPEGHTCGLPHTGRLESVHSSMALFRGARKHSLDKAAALHPQSTLVLTVLPAAKGWQTNSKGQATAKKAVTVHSRRGCAWRGVDTLRCPHSQRGEGTRAAASPFIASRSRPGGLCPSRPPSPTGEQGLLTAPGTAVWLRRPRTHTSKGHLQRGRQGVGTSRLPPAPTCLSIPLLGAAWQAVKLLGSAQGSPPLGRWACCGWTRLQQSSRRGAWSGCPARPGGWRSQGTAAGSGLG